MGTVRNSLLAIISSKVVYYISLLLVPHTREHRTRTEIHTNPGSSVLIKPRWILITVRNPRIPLPRILVVSTITMPRNQTIIRIPIIQASIIYTEARNQMSTLLTYPQLNTYTRNVIARSNLGTSYSGTLGINAKLTLLRKQTYTLQISLELSNLLR